MDGIATLGEVTELCLDLACGSEVYGRVVDDRGLPVADALIWLSARGTARSGYVVTASERDGRFVVRDVALPRFLAARAAGFSESCLYHARYGGPAEEVVIRINGRGAMVDITALDGATGRPVGPGAAYVYGTSGWQCRTDEPDAAGGPPPFSVQLDADGHAHVESVPYGSAKIVLRCDGFASWVTDVSLDGTSGATVVATLVRGVKVSGIVRSTDGTAIADAVISHGERGSFEELVARSNEQGVYELTGVTPGVADVTAVSAEWGSDKTQLETASGDAVEWDPVLEGPRLLVGRLLDRNDKGIPGWLVHLTAASSASGVSAASGTTDGDGWFNIRHQFNGACRLEAAPPVAAGASISESIVLPTRMPVVLRTAAAVECGNVRGIILGCAELNGAATLESVNRDNPDLNAECILDLSGAFNLTNLPYGRYEVTISSGGFVIARLDDVDVRAPITDLGTVALAPCGSLDIAIVGESRENVPLVWISGAKDNERRAVRIIQGRAHLGGLSAGEYYIVVDAENVALAGKSVTVGIGSRSFLELNAEDASSRAISIGGHVGEAGDEASVELLTEDDVLLARRRVEVGSDGRLRFHANLGRGGLRVVVRTANGDVMSGDFALEAGNSSASIEIDVGA